MLYSRNIIPFYSSLEWTFVMFVPFSNWITLHFLNILKASTILWRSLSSCKCHWFGTHFKKEMCTINLDTENEKEISFKVEKILHVRTKNGYIEYFVKFKNKIEELHLWRMIQTRRSTSWRKRRKIPTWSKCKGWRGWDLWRCDPDSLEVIDNNKDLQLDRHGQVHLLQRHPRRRANSPKSCQQISRPTFEKWRTNWRREPIAKWWECWTCKTI